MIANTPPRTNQAAPTPAPAPALQPKGVGKPRSRSSPTMALVRAGPLLLPAALSTDSNPESARGKRK
jgi:hypothetical protein